MNQVLLTLGALTLGGSAAVLLLAWVGRSTRGRYGARWRCWGWLLLCLRLAVPVPLIPQVQTRAPIQVDIPDPPAAVLPISPTTPPGSGGEENALPSSSPEQPPKQSDASLPLEEPASGNAYPAFRPTPAQIVFALWLLGAAAVLVWNIAAHLRFLRYLRRWSAPVEDDEAIAAFNRLGDQLCLDKRPRLLVCQGLKVPMLAGAFRPAILLPQEAVTGGELAFSLLHELTHYRRGDIWRKLLALWVNALHWFNPLMWLMVRLLERDTELACDEEALRRLPPEDYSAYGQTILNAVARLQNREPKGEHNE